MKKLLVSLVLVSIVSVSSCSGTRTKEDLQKYKGYSLQSFMNSAYPIRNVKTVTDVGYDAAFNHVNYGRLYRPYNELKNFCELNDGTLIQIKQYKDNPMRSHLRNPVTEYKKQYQLARSLGFNDYQASLSARGKASKVVQSNNWVKGDGDDARVLYKAVHEDKIFGSFNCEIDKKTAWSIYIVPGKFKPGHPTNQVDTAVLTINFGILK